MAATRPFTRFILPTPGEVGLYVVKCIGALALYRILRNPYVGRLSPGEFGRLHGVSNQQVSMWIAEGVITDVVTQDNGRIWIPAGHARPPLVRLARSPRTPRPKLRLPVLADFCVRIRGNTGQIEYQHFGSELGARDWLATMLTNRPKYSYKGERDADDQNRKVPVHAFTTLAHDGHDDVLWPAPKTPEERAHRL